MRKICYLKLATANMVERMSSSKLYTMPTGLAHVYPVDSSSLCSIGERTAFLKSDYPDFYHWYHRKVCPGLIDRSREIFLAVDIEERHLAGILILKHSRTEKKICTLCVFAPYQRCGIGTRFVEISSECLETSTPLITVSSNHIKEYMDFFKKLSPAAPVHFTLYHSYENYYRNSVTEYAFNGTLPRRLKLAANV